MTATVEVPISAVLDAAAALYALGDLFPIIAGGEQPDCDNLGTDAARELLFAAGLARPTSDGGDIVVFGEGWDGVNQREDRILASLLSTVASRAATEAARHAEFADA